MFLDLTNKFNFAHQSFERNYTYPALFLGIGYTTGNLTAGVKYDVLFDEDDSIYSSALVPFISVYF